MAKRLRGIESIIPHYPPDNDRGAYAPLVWYGDDTLNAADGPWYDAVPGSIYIHQQSTAGNGYIKIADTGTFNDWVELGSSSGFSLIQANGAASAAQKAVTVDSTTGLVAGCYVEYALATGIIERNVVATVDSGTQLTFTTNIGTGGIANNALLAVIPVSLYNVQHTRLTAVYCFGDSLSVDGTYDTQLQASLGSTWVVRSAGVGGNLTSDMATRLDTHVLQAGDAAYVIVLGGINDVLNDVAAATIETNLQTIYTAIATAGAKVVAVTITPFKTHASWTSDRQTVVDTVNTWILNTASDVDYAIDGYDALEEGTTDTLAAAYDNGDHLHLSTAGYAALGTAIYGAATWTASTTPVAITASGPSIGINQSMLTTDDVTFHNITATGTLNVPSWQPETDSTTALQIADSDGVAIVTFDTDNLLVGIGADPEAGKKLLLSYSSSSTLVGAEIRSLGIDVSGTVYNRCLLVSPYNYALNANSAVDYQLGIAVQQTLTSGAGHTVSVSTLSGIDINEPLLQGAGTETVTTNFGMRILNQGATGITTAYGLFIYDQADATNNWAIYTMSGKHQFGDADATIGFYGVTPIAQAVLATGGSASVDDVITALQNLGLVKQS